MARTRSTSNQSQPISTQTTAPTRTPASTVVVSNPVDPQGTAAQVTSSVPSAPVPPTVPPATVQVSGSQGPIAPNMSIPPAMFVDSTVLANAPLGLQYSTTVFPASNTVGRSHNPFQAEGSGLNRQRDEPLYIAGLVPNRT